MHFFPDCCVSNYSFGLSSIVKEYFIVLLRKCKQCHYFLSCYLAHYGCPVSIGMRGLALPQILFMATVIMVTTTINTMIMIIMIIIIALTHTMNMTVHRYREACRSQILLDICTGCLKKVPNRILRAMYVRIFWRSQILLNVIL